MHSDVYIYYVYVYIYVYLSCSKTITHPLTHTHTHTHALAHKHLLTCSFSLSRFLSLSPHAHTHIYTHTHIHTHTHTRRRDTNSVWQPPNRRCACTSQCVAVWRSVAQSTMSTMCWILLQSVALRCSVLHFVAVSSSVICDVPSSRFSPYFLITFLRQK